MRFLGCDIGKQRDPTAIAIVEGFDVLWLERMPLGTPYPRVVDRIAELAAAGRCEAVVIDGTGIGAAIVDQIEARGLEPVAITLTGGANVRVTGRRASLPRSALHLPLQAAMEAGRLRVAEGCPYRAELAAELLAARGGPSGAESRTRDAHGDLMVAVSLALWWQGAARLLPA